MSFSLTVKQSEAWDVIGGPAKHVLLAGGSRSGKTLLDCRAIAMRALAARKSRHALLRFRFNAVVQSIVMDTWPKMMELCFPSVDYEINKSLWFARMPNDSEVWFGGLDDKERTEKILGNEYATLKFNEVSQIPYGSVTLALTRLAQSCVAIVNGESRPLRLKALYDCNPPSKAHWSYKLFVRKVDPDSGKPLTDPDDYQMVTLNPSDNVSNLPSDYLADLAKLPARMRSRFLEGKFSDATPNQLFNLDDIEKWRVIDGSTPDFVRVVVAVDPSGSGDIDNADNDAIGIIVAALGTDGNAYVLEDCTVKVGPATWGKIATDAYDRHAADVVVGEVNYGGEMVRHTIQTARARTPYKAVHATRGKSVRAEPIAALYEQGKVRHVGNFRELEDEMSGFSTVGYVGDRSPNRADALIWGLTEIFPGVVAGKKEPRKDEPVRRSYQSGAQGWMGS